MKKKRPSQTIKPETAPLELTVQYAFRKAGAARRPWAPTRHMIALWAYAALGPRRTPCDLAVRVVGAAESRRLNKQFRGKDKPTNVLSFPATVAQADGRRPLGDLIVCAPVVAEEAAQQAKSREAHWAHMVVHGTLHLLGYDHERGADAARRMERHEVKILKSLGYSDPYEEKKVN